MKLINIENIEFLNRCKNFHWYRCVPKNDNEAYFFRHQIQDRLKYDFVLSHPHLI